MNPANAFAQPRHDLPSDHILKDMATETLTKRRNLEQEPQIFSREADFDTALEVDYMILDYLAYQCTTGRLDSSAEVLAQDQVLQNNQYLFDAFLPIFKTRHPHFSPEPQLRFRLGLLKFVSLYTTRLTHCYETPSAEALKTLRNDNRTRALHWIRDPTRIPSSVSSEMRSRYDTELPILELDLARNRSSFRAKLSPEPQQIENSSGFYGTSSSVSLLDLLPLFMEVSATINTIYNGASSEIWMQLATEFMMQACLEQYLVNGVSGTDAIDEAFAYGYQPDLAPYNANARLSKDDTSRSVTEIEHMINAMFEHPEYAIETPNWTKLRKTYLLELLSLESTNLSSKLEEVAQKHPIEVFHEELMEFVEGISKAIPKPVLVQLESGRLDSLTQQETKALIDRCGEARDVFESV